MSTTKLRSTLIAGCFLSYGIGCIAINLTTYYVDKAQWLVILASVLVIGTVVPSYFSYFESPMWLVGKGKFTEAMRTFAGIKLKNFEQTNKSLTQGEM